MARINLQFHATQEEIIGLIKKLLISFNLYMVSIKVFPTFQWHLVSINEFEDKLNIINESQMIFLCASKPHEVPNEYMRFLDENKNSLVFTIGKQKDNILRESSIGTLAEDIEILKMWKNIINEFKKTMLKGAWVINPKNGAKEFYKNHYYTSMAQKVFQDGCQISPSAGWNLYYLSHDV